MRFLASSPVDPQLMQLLQAAAAADSSSPTFFSVSPTGQTQAEFEGFVKALGLELEEVLAEFSGETGSVDVINWFNKTLGKITQQIRGWHTVDPTKAHTLELLGIGLKLKAAIQVTGSGGAGNNNRIEALLGEVEAGGHFTNGLRILEGTGETPFLPLSDFIQMGGHSGDSKHVVLTGGLIQGSNGAILQKTQFLSSCTRTAVGTYTIVLNETENHQTQCMMTGCDAQNTGRMFSYANTLSNPSTYVVTMRNPSTFATEDISFSFHVLTSN